MKPVCEKCPMLDKSVSVCQRRQCKDAEPLPPPPPPSPPRFPMSVGSEIDTGDSRLQVIHMDETGNFDALVEYLEDKSREHGHYGSYVTEGRYYRFTLLQEDSGELLWEVPEEGTERFHREGSTGAQFLLYWFKDRGFSLDLDS